jgi:hypothetical protein
MQTILTLSKKSLKKQERSSHSHATNPNWKNPKYIGRFNMDFVSKITFDKLTENIIVTQFNPGVTLIGPFSFLHDYIIQNPMRCNRQRRSFSDKANFINYPLNSWTFNDWLEEYEGLKKLASNDDKE